MRSCVRFSCGSLSSRLQDRDRCDKVGGIKNIPICLSAGCVSMVLTGRGFDEVDEAKLRLTRLVKWN